MQNTEATQSAKPFAQINAISPKETGAHIGVTPQMVLKLIAQGELQAFKVGRAVRIHVESIEAYVARNAITPSAEVTA